MRESGLSSNWSNTPPAAGSGGRRRKPLCLGAAAVALIVLWAAAVGAGACPYTVSFAGNRTLGRQALIKAASQELAAFGDNGCRRADVDDAAYQMETHYRSHGFAFARVTYHIGTGKKSTPVVFSVEEGPRVRVQSLRFSGNHHFGEATIQDMFHWQRTDFNPPHAPIFTQAELDEAIARLEDAYVAAGFLDAIVDAATPAFNASKDAADITVHITEGTRYMVRAVRVFQTKGGAPAPCTPALCTSLVGAPYSRRKKTLLKSALTSDARNRGHAWASVSVRETAGEAPGDVVLEAAVDAGPVVTIDAVRIQGNRKTREAFIRNRLALKPGATYSEEKERESFRDLYRTGLFATIDISLDPTPNPTHAVLTVSVKEAPATELYVEPGWGSYELLRLKAGARYQNLFGIGLIFNPEASISVKDHRASLRLTEPGFFVPEVTADLPMYYQYREEPSFTRRDIGFAVTLGRTFGNRWKGAAGYNLRKTDVADNGTPAETDPTDTDYDLGSVTFQVTRDTRNDIFFPTKGRRLFAAVEHADTFLGGSITLSRITAGWRRFRLLGEKTVVAMRYTAGLMLPGTEDVTAPISERFFNGGGNSVRSFRESALGPRQLNGDPAGGYGFNTVNMELRHRMHGNLIVTAFVDMGNVSPNRTRAERDLAPYGNRNAVFTETIEDFFTGMRFGIGTGLLYLLPVGPLRLDAAVNPDADTARGEDDYVIHFSIGSAF